MSDIKFHKVQQVLSEMQSSSNFQMNDNVSFPLKLYNLIESLTPTSESVGDPIIGWLHHGKSFCIYNPTKFELEIIPKYFKRK